MQTIDAAASDLMARLHRMAARAILTSRDESKPEIVRDVCAAYYQQVHRNMRDFLAAAIRNLDAKAIIEGERSYLVPGTEFDLTSFIINLPCRWEFDFTWIVGSVNDAHWCAHQYKWVKFIGVHPLSESDPYNSIRIPIFHKENSRFRIGYEGRKRMKAALGSKYRSLVNFARKKTKTEFLAEFNLPAPDRSRQLRVEYPGGMVSYQDIHPYKSKQCVHIEADELLRKTGYTPDDFWREVKKPGTVTPKKPQLELTL